MKYTHNLVKKDYYTTPIAFLDWYDIQDENYRYVAWLENDDTFRVKIVIHNFLYAEAIFPQGDLQ